MALAVVSLVLCGCGSRAKQTASDANASAPNTQQVKPLKPFVPTLAPASFSPEQKTLYMNQHYWDKFDFSDSTFILRADTSSMLTSFAVYAVGCFPDSLIDK